MPAQDEVYRGVTRFFAFIITGFGVSILVMTLARGGGVTSLGFLIGIVFVGLGLGRLYLSLRSEG